MSLTLCIFKPDLADSRVKSGQALLRMLAVDLLPINLVLTRMTEAQAEKLYAAHKGQPYYKRNIEHVTSGLSMIIVIDGELAVERLRDLVGSTDPNKARPGTLRALYGKGMPNNAVHASSSADEAAREIAIFFEGVNDVAG
jgi:nucleoside-diphosphate kinase